MFGRSAAGDFALALIHGKFYLRRNLDSRIIMSNIKTIMRKMLKKLAVTLAVILVPVLMIQGARSLSAFSKSDFFDPISHRVKGNPKAPVHIIEYIDFRCGPCAYGSRWLRKFMEEHPGEVFLEVRYYPIHLSHGALTARFAECALTQKKFWEVHDSLIQTQPDWIRLVNPEAKFLEIARDQGLDVVALEACWNDPSLYDRIMAVKKQGRDLGVDATPTYFVNGDMVVGAKRLSDELKRIMDSEKKLPLTTEGTQ